MPFAPVITAEKAATVFDVSPVNSYACSFMTITCNVKPQWRQRIAAVVHVDGTARPQIIERDTNPLYYDILNAFERESSLPVLVNTSFNVHEEPIVNKPSECIRALLDGRIDFVVTTQGPGRRLTQKSGERVKGMRSSCPVPYRRWRNPLNRPSEPITSNFGSGLTLLFMMRLRNKSGRR